jgi:DNA-binding NarL/FixJ family response regulator
VQVQLGPAWQKDWDTGGLLDAERALAEAYLLVGDGATDVAGESPVRALSARERQVALLLSDGFSNQAIAEALRIRASTVRLHVSHVLGKLGLQSRMQVAARLRDPHALA